MEDDPLTPFSPDYYWTEEDDHVVITCLSQTLTKEMLPPDKDLIIYADQLTIDSDIAFAGKNITINAREIISENGSIDTTPEITLDSYQPEDRAKDGDAGVESGEDGTNGDKGKSGGAGINAGNITLVAESLIGDIKLTATGGEGGRGQDGGKGGKGADGKEGQDAECSGNLGLTKDSSAGGDGGNGGNGGGGGNSGNGGKGGQITIGYVNNEGDVPGDYGYEDPYWIDAAIHWDESTAYFFQGDTCFSVEVNKTSIVDGVKNTAFTEPQKIADVWPEIPDDFKNGIDAAADALDGGAYFFKGDQCLKLNTDDYTVEAGYPKLIAEEWPILEEFFQSDLDAAWRKDDGTEANNWMYFIKGDKYCYIDLDDQTSVSEDSLSKFMYNHGTNSDYFSADLSAIVRWTDQTIYLFKGDTLLTGDYLLEEYGKYYSIKADLWSDLYTFLKGGWSGVVSKGGAGGKKGKGGTGGQKIDPDPYGTYGSASASYHCNPDGEEAGGKDGKDGTEGNNGKVGTIGRGGSFIILEEFTYNSLMEDYPSTIAQRLITQRQAELYYLNSDYDNAIVLFSWLQKVTPDPEDKKTEDMDEWELIHQKATIMLARLSQGLNYYSHPTDYVPLASLEAYETRLSSLTTNGLLIEEQYNNYMADKQSKDNRDTALKEALLLVDQTKKDLNSSITNATNQKTETQNTIAKMWKELQDQYVIVDNAEDAFKDAVMEKITGEFACSVFKDVVAAVPALVKMASGDYKAAKDLSDPAKDIYNSYNTYENSIDQIETAENDLDDILYASSKIVEDPDNPDAGKIVMEEQKLEAVLEPFKDIAEAQAFKEEVDNFLDLIQTRNQKVFEYNSLVTQIDDLNTQLAQKIQEENRLNDLLSADYDPTAEDFRAFMDRIYGETVSQLTKEIFEYNEAFVYWSLTESTFYIENQTVAELTSFYNSIQDQILYYINGSGGPVATSSEPFVSQSHPFQLTSENRKKQFDAFKDTEADTFGKITFSIPLDDADYVYDNYRDMAQVLVTKFKISIPNARTDNGELVIFLTHNGQACFLDKQGDFWSFSHVALLTDYRFKYETDPETGDETIQYLAGGELGGADDEYIGLSPFTSWSLEIPVADNPGLNLSEVDEITIEFEGRYYPMLPVDDKKVIPKKKVSEMPSYRVHRVGRTIKKLQKLRTGRETIKKDKTII